VGAGRKLTYEEARELAAAADPSVRAELAARPDLQPEILYYLAEDSSAEVRRRVARNEQAPPQANLLLAGDGDEAVRSDLAAKIVRLAPGLSANEHDRLRRLTYETVEILARDQITKVREIMAQALKDVADAPPEVIRRLARDAEIVVAGPVLQYSPVLGDDDLLEIIGTHPIPGALAAISKRSIVNTRVADAIAATDDVDAIATLLGNASAQIREETLDRLVDRAADIEPWHRPLAERPQLSCKAAGKLARFVAANLLQGLAARQDLPPDAAAAVAAVVRKRLDELEATGPAKAEANRAADESSALTRAQQLKFQNRLDESTVDAALAGGDHAFVVAALSVLAGVSVATVKKTVQTQSAKGIVAITWRAGLSMAFCSQLQAKLMHMPSSRQLHSASGTFPLSQQEMVWQLEFLDA
jgi:uncharacterized protein (DUF2336 family)